MRPVGNVFLISGVKKKNYTTGEYSDAEKGLVVAGVRLDYTSWCRLPVRAKADISLVMLVENNHLLSHSFKFVIY
jgi:hypothetical protein